MAWKAFVGHLIYPASDRTEVIPPPSAVVTVLFFIFLPSASVGATTSFSHASHIVELCLLHILR